MSELVSTYKWMSGHDTGASSISIAMHMTSGWCRGDYPHDPEDLGRCLRLLKKFPAWNARIREMAAYGPEWKALSEAWERLSSSMEEEVGIHWSKGKSAPSTCDLMQQVIEHARRGHDDGGSGTATAESGPVA